MRASDIRPAYESTAPAINFGWMIRSADASDASALSDS
jgi:hypothetical protein